MDADERNRENTDGTAKRKPSVLLVTFGCQMNEADTELVYGMLLSQGYEKAEKPAKADVILFNTCSVRKHAEDRIWGAVGELIRPQAGRKPQTLTPKTIIGIIGCMAKAHGEKIFKKLPQVNFICGPSDIYEIVNLIEQATKNPKGHFAAISKKARLLKAADSGPSYREEKTKALVNISYGCNNFCSYCIVPYVRGREISRKSEDIVDEVKRLADDGVKEVMLLGQNVNSYGKTAGSFVKLLEKINKIDTLLRVRFMTSHPKDASPDLFKAMRDLDKVCEHLHLPVQSGSDRILKLMNRKYTSSDYKKLIEKYKKIVNNGSVTTDFIVGFPSETEEDLYKTYMLAKCVEFDGAFIFKYSPRPHTDALKMKDDVEKSQKEHRNQVLLKLQGEITKKKNSLFINKTVEALGISRAKRAPERWGQFPAETAPIFIKGRIRQNQQVIYPGGAEFIGAIAKVKIKDTEGNMLIGERT